MTAPGEAQQRAAPTLREQAENFWLPPYKRTPPLPIAPWQRPADDLHEFVLALVERVEAQREQMRVLMDEERRMSTAYGEARNDLAVAVERVEAQDAYIEAHKRDGLREVFAFAAGACEQLEEQRDEAETRVAELVEALRDVGKWLAASDAPLPIIQSVEMVLAGVPVAEEETT